MPRKIFPVVVLLLSSFLWLEPSAVSLATTASGATVFSSHTSLATLSGTLIFTAEQNGHWDLYGAAQDRAPARLTRDANPAQGISIARDGTLAFASKRDGNWEIYTSALDGSNLKRLTNILAYDGNPVWSPDGSQIVFESMRADDLDIWVMNADGTNATNLTEANPTYDFDPTWSPDGKWIAYTSLQNSYKQIMLVAANGGTPINLSNAKADDEQPAWSPDGKTLAFVSNRDGQRAIYFAAVNLDAKKLDRVRRVTFFGWDFAPAFSPDGQTLAFISTRPNRQTIYILPLASTANPSSTSPATGNIPRAIDDEPLWVSSFAWTDRALPDLKTQSAPDDPPLIVEQPQRAAPNAGYPYEIAGVTQIFLAPSYGNMSSAVSTSLLALRDRLKKESGQDYLGQLSDMMRQLVYPCDSTCDIFSWHKTGRAFDSLWEYGVASQGLLEIVPEQQNGELYWRLYLRASKQDGTMGEPLTDYPWDFSYSARVSGNGGAEKPIPNGYYVDLTELAREYGWTRIPSADDPDYDWHDNFLALEYWHYEKRDSLTWFQAMLQVFTPDDLKIFDWQTLAATRHEPEIHMYIKDIPPPPSAWKWYAILPSDN